MVEAGDAWEVHHLQLCSGFSTTAINPFGFSYHQRNGEFWHEIKGEDYPKAKKNYIKSVGDGLLKIFKNGEFQR